MSKKLKVLFLCTRNSCRSQMAEGWARHLKDDVIEAYSAGVENGSLNQNAVKVMAEAGVNISGHKPKHIDEFIPGNCKVLHVGFDDPPKMAKELAEQDASEEEQLECYRKVRDEIKRFIETLPEALNK